MSRCFECGATLDEGALFCGQCGTSLATAVGRTPAPDPWIGRLVDRRYRVLSLLGRGGMGMVYKVEHVHLGKNAAMKVLLPGSAQDPEMVRRFRIEAQAVSRLNHPNIVQTFDFGMWEGALYLVMEHVNGHDLASLVAEHGPLSYQRAIPLFAQICSALTEAHDLGVIHRDVKPENLMVLRRRDGSEHAKVLDFGLAKLRAHSGTSETAPGHQVIGSPDYMSPEQIRAEPLDLRADIYGLGASLYRVLTGMAPFSASTPIAVLTQHILDPLPPMRQRRADLDLPRSLEAIVQKAMAKKRESRHGSARELQDELESALANASGLPEANLDWRQSARTASQAGFEERANSGFEESQPPPAQTSSGGRLRRGEFDAFERSLRRRRWLGVVALPAAVLAALTLGWMWQSKKNRERASGEEREPNDTPSTATALSRDLPVFGHVGKLLGTGQPDLDYFHIPAGSHTRAVSARLEGIHGVDLVLELFDSSGVQIAKSDSRGVDGGEWIQPTRIGSVDGYILVRQVWMQGAPLLENVPEAYQLTVHWAETGPDWEIEPNDRPEQATAARVGTPMKGYLGSLDDHDWFEYRAERAGALLARVAAPANVEMVLELENEGEPSLPPLPLARRTKAAPSIANRQAGPDTRIPVVAGQYVRVAVRRRPSAGLDPKAPENAAGLHADESYVLDVEASVPFERSIGK